MADDILDTTWGFRMLPELNLRRQQLSEQRRYRQDIARERSEQNRIRREQMVAQFGPYAVTGPDGELDIQASARAQQSARQAAELGQAEALSGQSFADIPQDIRNLPEYRQGWASGMAARALEEERFGRQTALQEQRGQTAEEVARIRSENAQLRSLLTGEKAAPGELVDISEEVEGLGKVSRKVPASELPTLREAALRRREEKPVRDAIQGLKGALREIEGVEGDKVSLDFPQGKEPRVSPGGWMGLGGVTKAAARKELKARIQNLEGLLGRTVGQEGDGATKPDLRPPGPRVPQGTNPPAGAGIVQPRGTNVFNVMRDPSGAWKVY